MDQAKLDWIARTCHEVNRVYSAEGLRDPSHKPWAETTDELRESIREGVLKAIGGTTPQQSHESWMVNRINHGWTYGLQKDYVKKTHPNLVSYGALPETQQLKDQLFVTIARALNRF